MGSVLLGEGCLLRSTLEWLQSCSMQVTVSVQVSPATLLRKPVKPVDWHHVNRGIVDFQDWEGRELTFFNTYHRIFHFMVVQSGYLRSFYS